MSAPLLLPAPRTLHMLGGAITLANARPEAEDSAAITNDESLPTEAYTLDIDSLPIRIASSSATGLRYARHTLSQLVRQYGRDLPRLHISDAPAFATRGVMLDVSRNKVPSLAQLKQTIDLLAALKFNHLQFYTEHTFAYSGHEEVWQDASPLTSAEIRELDAYGSARGVELAANQNCFGHLAVWLKRPRYNSLAEIEGDNVWKFMQWDRRGPFSLCPILPESEAFVRDLLGQLLPCFRSPLVNIGCDETFDVGHGRSRPEVARRAAAEFAGNESKARACLFFEFTRKICDIAREHAKRPMFWADIAMSHADMLGLLPRDAIGLAWGYEPDAKFAEEARHLHAHGMTAWVCPGTSTWRSVTGRTQESRGNMLAAAACSGMPNVSGFLVCDWGDVGHMQHWPLTQHALGFAAQCAWGGASAPPADDRAISLHALDDDSLQLAPWLASLGNLDLPIRERVKLRNASALFNDLFPPVPPAPGRRSINAPLQDWVSCGERLDQLSRERPPITDPLHKSELDHTLAMTRLCLDHAISCRRSADGLAPSAPDRPLLRQQAASSLAELRRLWLIRNRPGGMQEASEHLRRVVADLA